VSPLLYESSIAVLFFLPIFSAHPPCLLVKAIVLMLHHCSAHMFAGLHHIATWICPKDTFPTKIQWLKKNSFFSMKTNIK
jgi:hypothetical protein